MTEVAEHEMIVADPVRPRRYTWNGNPADQDEVRQVFEERMATGLFVASVSTDKPKVYDQVDEFDPKARTILLTPALAGG